MAPRRCAVKECDSVSGKQRGIGFHTFPNNPIYRQIWLTNCGMPDTKAITKCTLVCSRHFRSTDFLWPLKKKFILKQAAVPTIFPWGTLPYVEPKPHVTIESGQRDWLANFVDDEPAEINQHFFDETVEIKSEFNPAIGEKQSKSDDTGEPMKKALRLSVDCKEFKNESAVFTPTTPSSIFDQFVPGTRIEAQDYQEVWHYAKVIEVDMEEKEVLIYFEKNIKSRAPPTAPEWISMNSSRLRPLQTLKETFVRYFVGDECIARWTDTRKYPATVQKVLENNTYEVLFDDGFIKVVKARHMSKAKIRKGRTPKSSIVHKSNPHLPIPKYDLSKLNLLPVPRDGEWCCNWVNGIPVGTESYLIARNGYRRQTVLVDDWRLPEGWTKHLQHRSDVCGKWDVVLVGPTKKRFRSKNDVKLYLEEKGEAYNPDIFDFSTHIKRAKQIGLFVFTEEYKKKLKKKPKQLAPAPPNPGFVYVGALKVELIDNLFNCPKETCKKNFRKKNHLQIHIQHSHEDLAKLLGVCLNMSDLAYQRTVGQPIDESIPKNNIVNSHHFEQVYLPDLISTAESKSISPSMPPVKVEQNSPSFDEEVNILSLPTGDIKIELSEQYELTIDSSIEPAYQFQDFIGHSMTDLTGIL